MKDNRKYIRLNAHLDVAWEKIFEPRQPMASQEDTAKNISEGGICLNMKEKVGVGSFLDVTIKLPSRKTICCKSRVQWVKETEVITKRYDVGLEFLDISPQDREEIKNFVNASFPK
jgi:c-di-GMP-binding flagellar brake protein YcgR